MQEAGQRFLQGQRHLQSPWRGSSREQREGATLGICSFPSSPPLVPLPVVKADLSFTSLAQPVLYQHRDVHKACEMPQMRAQPPAERLKCKEKPIPRREQAALRSAGFRESERRSRRSKESGCAGAGQKQHQLPPQSSRR